MVINGICMKIKMNLNSYQWHMYNTVTAIHVPLPSLSVTAQLSTVNLDYFNQHPNLLLHPFSQYFIGEAILLCLIDLTVAEIRFYNFDLHVTMSNNNVHTSNDSIDTFDVKSKITIPNGPFGEPLSQLTENQITLLPSSTKLLPSMIHHWTTMVYQTSINLHLIQHLILLQFQ